VNLSQLCRQLLVIHREVRDLQVRALMTTTLAELRAVRRLESFARGIRRDLCRRIRDEVRLRCSAWEAGRSYSQTERADRSHR
jgi:hypothetical protein